MNNDNDIISTIDSTYGYYSSNIIKLLKSKDILPGDKIEINQNDKTLIGNLITQNELGNENNIIIKLENGYNIGIKYTNDTTLKKLSGSIKLEDFKIKNATQSQNLPKISLLSTGGTIASRIDYQSGGVVMAMKPEEIFAGLPELFQEITFEDVKHLFSFGSEDLSKNEWKKIAEEVASQINDNDINGVVITHGTDTMGYTSAILSFMLQDLPMPVVLTGAQKSSDRGSYDGATNLIAASRVAAKSDLASVLVAMHHTSDDNYIQLSRGTKVRKMHTSRRDAFQTINESPVGLISPDGKITQLIDDIPKRSDGNVHLMNKFDDNIALIKIYPGINPELLDWYIDRNVKGIIIEGTGLGHVPTYPDKTNMSWTPSIQRAIEENIYVGMTSQCLNGRVHPFVYRALRSNYQIGVSYLQDMLPETALLKLGWVLGNYDYEDLRATMEQNIAGEINLSIKFKEYSQNE